MSQYQPPPIPISEPNDMPAWVSWSMVILGAVLLAIGVYSLITFLYGLSQLYSVSYMGTDFFFQYLAGSHYNIFLALVSLLGGIGLVLRMRFGWILGVASAILNLILLGVSVFLYDLLGGLELASGFFLLLNFLIHFTYFALLIFLLLPQVRTGLKLKNTHWGFTIALTFLLIMDYLISTLILAPEF